MPSLYAQFVEEILDLKTLEDQDSFVTYEIEKAGNISCLKILNMYIDKKSRGRNKSIELLDKMKNIAYSEDCTCLSADISKEFNEFIQQRSIHICRLYGMSKVYEDNKIYTYSRGL
jgi:hypothetical protein